MGYFDGFTRSSFKTTEDGQRLFFPWGSPGQGFVIPSETEFERLRRRVKSYWLIYLSVIAIAGSLQGILVTAVVMIFILAFYVAWARFQCSRLQRSEVKFTRSDRAAAREANIRSVSPIALWLSELACLAFVGMGVRILVVCPGKWPTAVARIAIFGFGAAVIARALVLKRRHSESGA
jgi:hypothetical protein